jgi:Ala-tRNA(Pro) deacylase
MKTPRVREYLNSQHVDYETIQHAETFTSMETAEAARIHGRLLAKTLVVEMDGSMALVVIPATCKLVSRDLASALNKADVHLVPENQFRDKFPDCELGAMSPLGNLYGMDVLIAKELIEQDEIVFNDGTHTCLMRMQTRDLLKLTNAARIDQGYEVIGETAPSPLKRRRDWLHH